MLANFVMVLAAMPAQARIAQHTVITAEMAHNLFACDECGDKTRAGPSPRALQSKKL